MAKINKDSKFYIPKTRERKLEDLKHTFLFWKGRSKGMIFTRSIELDDFRYIFFPKGFEEKYGYLGTSIYEESHYFNAIYPLVLALDYEAKPKWCPRWFLRFTHVFGNDKSIVRVRNWTLHNLHNKLTKGIGFIDWKTKWSDYDLRISISAPDHLQDLADNIERGVYSRGRQQELLQEIKALDPDANPIMGSVKRLEEELERLENEKALNMVTASAQELDLDHNVTADGNIKFKHEK